nr:retrovirus-related Pol polyprotein from transposon TNT 1-94 [Tanacetum cinerariifolium]
MFTSTVFDCDELNSSESDVSVPASPVHDRYQSGERYHDVPYPYTGTFMPYKPDLVFHDASTISETVHAVFNVMPSTTKPTKDMSQSNRPSAPIIEDWISDLEDESEGKPMPIQKEPSFVQTSEHVKTPRTSVKSGNPQQALKDKSVIDSGCSRDMTGNISYLSDFEEINGGYVAFGENPKCGKITSKDSLLPISFWAEAVNTACYVQNRVLVTKPHNKTPYELLLGRTSSIGFMRPFGCPVTILNTLDPLGKFNGKAAKGFLVGYSVGSRPAWLFDIDTLTQSMNFQPVVVRNQPSSSACIQGNFDADPQNTDADAAFDDKENESEVHVSPSSSDKPKKHDEKAKKEAKGKSPIDLSTGDRYLSDEFEETTLTGLMLPQLLENYQSLRQHVLKQLLVYKDRSECISLRLYRLVLYQHIVRIVNAIEDIVLEEGIEYEEFFTPVVRIEAIRLFLAYAFFMGFMHSMGCIKLLELSMRHWPAIFWKNGFQKGKIDQILFIKKQKGDILLFQVYVDDIIFGSTNKELYGKSASTPIDTEKPLLKDPDGEDVDVHIYSDYDRASLDRMSITRGCQILGCRLISWQCKKQTVVATSSTEAKYVADASYCAQVLWIQNQLLDYGLIITVVGYMLMLFGLTNDVVHLMLLGFDQIVGFLNAHTIQYALVVNQTIYVSCIKQFWASLSIKKSNDVVKLQALIDRKKYISVKRTTWNEFSSSMALVVICLATGRKFNFSKYIFDSLDVARVQEDENDEVSVAPTPPSPTPATTSPLQQEHIPSPPQAQSAQPSSPPHQQPSQTSRIS